MMGLSPNMAPLYCRAIGTDSGRANSTNTNLHTNSHTHTHTHTYELGTLEIHQENSHLVGWVSSPAMRTYLISPQGRKKLRT